jgi:hypothetical protein
MTHSIDFSGLRSSLTYQPYLALTIGVDAEWSQKRGKHVGAPHLSVQQKLAKLCSGYAKGIEDNCTRFRNTTTSGDCAVKPYLFNPLFYIPWGTSDNLAIVLMDDFVPVHHVTTALNTAVEDLSLGFCPILDGEDREEDPYTCHLHNLFSIDRAATERRFDESVHHYQRDRPFLVFTRLKFDGFATTSYAIYFQQALMVTMRRLAREVLNSVLTQVREGGTWHDLASSEDVSSLQYCLVDLQGPEELGAYIFCRNYSVAMALVACFRNLTYGSLFESGDAGALFRDSLHQSKTFKRILRVAYPGRGVESKISANHLFRWTNTTLAVSPHVLFGSEAEKQKCNGIVSASAEFNIPPGHHSEFLARLKAGADGGPVASFDRDSLMFYEVGRGDYLCSYGLEGNEGKRELLSVKEVMSIASRNLDTFGTIQGEDKGRDVVDCKTILSIPIPKSLPGISVAPGSRLSPDHSAPWSVALREIQHRLCFSDDGLTEDDKATLGTHVGRLNLSKILSVPRQYGVPETLRRTVEFLFQNFSILVTDYFTFDSVIDLYDAFAALHATLTDYLPYKRKEELSHARDKWLPPLDEGRVRQITAYVEALHNAVAHRLAKGFSEPVSRDMAIDLRGGLNQVIAAADAPLKCGIGLLRKYVLGTNAQERPRRELVGGLTRISLEPGTRAVSLELGTESRCQLCFVEADVPHVLHVASFCDYFHEAGHLIYDAYKRRDLINGLSELLAIDRDRLAEVFAHMTTYMFAFAGRRRRAFIIHHLISLEKARAGVRGTDAEMIAQVTEVLIRLTIATLIVPSATARAEWSTMQWHSPLTDCHHRRNEIEQVMGWVGRVLPEWKRLWSTPQSDGWIYCRREFEHVFVGLEKYLKDLWKCASGLYAQYSKGTTLIREIDITNEVVAVVEKCLNEGRPMVRSGVTIPPLSGIAGSDRDENGVDSLLLTGTILAEYVSRIEADVGRELYLQRDAVDGKVEFPKSEVGWNTFLIDRGSAFMFCCVPDERGKRLQRQIAVLKTFWEVAANLRGRRVHDIIEDNWNR